jgi:hypothetical protein
MTILEAMQDEKIFAPWFKRKWLRGDSWQAWRSFLSALFALPMDDEARAIYTKHTGRTDVHAEPYHEGFVIAGRRSGKSLTAALVAVFLACFKSYDDVLAPGEVPTLMVIAADRRQARTIFQYIRGFLQTPMLKPLVQSELKESITLTSGVVIEIHTCSFRATRGYTLIGVIVDEVAFWSSEDSANPDTQVLNALRPALATTNGLLLGISSPYAKRGALYQAYRDSYGKPSDVLVWKASSREMNPTLSLAVVAAAYVRDAQSARAEYGGDFRDDVEGFISLEVVESRTVPGRRELAPLNGVEYVAFCDPSGGQADSMTLGIAHSERDLAVLDLLREVPAPFSPESVVKEFAETLKRYRISTVVGDRYAAEWCSEQFQKRGISYKPSEKNRSEIYLELLPILMSGQCELLDNDRLKNQLCGLERRVGRGRDVIDHAPGSHDDLSNSAAGALVLAMAAHGGILGLIVFEQLEAAGRLHTLQTTAQPWTKEYLFRLEARLLGLDPHRAARPDLSKPLEPATKPEKTFDCPRDPVGACSKCGSTCLLCVGGAGTRCQQCGHQFFSGGKGPAVSAGPSRGDYLAGRLPNARTFKFPGPR